MRESVFRFKKFECRHSESSMKIGVDAVLLGAWSEVENAGVILDVGTGCGVIALMCAQRNDHAQIIGTDIHEGSVEEARRNFRASPWSDRLSAVTDDFTTSRIRGVDLIISNPPYFDSGISHPESARLKARHQGDLSPKVLLDRGKEILNETGGICLILPAEQACGLIEYACNSGYCLERKCNVKGNGEAPVKRTLLQFTKCEILVKREDTLILETSRGIPTPEYKSLCHDFYLKF